MFLAILPLMLLFYAHHSLAAFQLSWTAVSWLIASFTTRGHSDEYMLAATCMMLYNIMRQGDFFVDGGEEEVLGTIGDAAGAGEQSAGAEEQTVGAIEQGPSYDEHASNAIEPDSESIEQASLSDGQSTTIKSPSDPAKVRAADGDSALTQNLSSTDTISVLSEEAPVQENGYTIYHAIPDLKRENAVLGGAWENRLALRRERFLVKNNKKSSFPVRAETTSQLLQEDDFLEEG